MDLTQNGPIRAYSSGIGSSSLSLVDLLNGGDRNSGAGYGHYPGLQQERRIKLSFQIIRPTYLLKRQVGS